MPAWSACCHGFSLGSFFVCDLDVVQLKQCGQLGDNISSILVILRLTATVKI
eukprot:m.48547 g.48547  ORF g.48547 m.48547 type:complete len:52 (-) comp13293_c0_seq2:384-539(-)